jgi:hypothetical protein
MDRRRYELLPDADEDIQPLPVTVTALPLSDCTPVRMTSSIAAVSSCLPSVTSESGTAHLESLEQPPSYSVAVDLPTYEECLRTKQEEEQRPETVVIQEMSSESRRQIASVIGSDGMFVLGFIFAFLFNWVGLVAAFCLMRTCAGRFGALAGFGLSLVKWVAIAKRNNWTVGVADENPWVWWMLVSFGVLISCSGTLQYLRIKYMWSRTRNADVINYPF